MNVDMKYSEFLSEIMKSIETDLDTNKKLFLDGSKAVDKYNLKLMKRDSTTNMAFDIKSDDSFEAVSKSVANMNEELKRHQVAQVSDAILETEEEWAGLYYYIYSYTPMDSFEDVSTWEQKDIIKQAMAVKLGFNSSRFLKCEIMNLYKEDIINLEQVVEAHTKGC